MERTATEVLLNLQRDNLALTAHPMYFVNEADQRKAHREQKAINAEISIGGKFWCLHDFTFICETLAKTAFEAGTALRWYKYLCVKCGKEKRLNTAQMNGYVENLHT